MGPHTKAGDFSRDAAELFCLIMEDSARLFEPLWAIDGPLDAGFAATDPDVF
jgi:hypothetical protein